MSELKEEIFKRLKPFYIGDVSFSNDFRSLSYKKVQVATFSTNAAIVLEALFTSYQNGHPEVHNLALLSLIYSSEKNLSGKSLYRNVFRNDPLWGKLIVQGQRRGTFKLDFSFLTTETNR